MNKKQTLSQQAQYYARTVHNTTNHKYDGHNYEVHLSFVVFVANDFIELIPEDKREIVLAACWAHDTIEDCRQTYNDVKYILGKEVAELVYALTNEKGRTRAERANQKYYDGINATPFAPFVKACDRIANVQYSIETNSKMLDVYVKENEAFISKLNWVGIEGMKDELQTMISLHLNNPKKSYSQTRSGGNRT